MLSRIHSTQDSIAKESVSRATAAGACDSEAVFWLYGPVEDFAVLKRGPWRLYTQGDASLTVTSQRSPSRFQADILEACLPPWDTSVRGSSVHALSCTPLQRRGDCLEIWNHICSPFCKQSSSPRRFFRLWGCHLLVDPCSGVLHSTTSRVCHWDQHSSSFNPRFAGAAPPIGNNAGRNWWYHHLLLPGWKVRCYMTNAGKRFKVEETAFCCVVFVVFVVLYPGSADPACTTMI